MSKHNRQEVGNGEIARALANLPLKSSEVDEGAVNTAGATEETDETPEVVAGERSQLEKLITGYVFEDADAGKTTEIKPEKAGQPTQFTRRLARVHFVLAGTDYKLMAANIKRVRRVWSRLVNGSTVVDKDETKIEIAQPGVMVGSMWMPAITRYGRTVADPELKALLERVRVEWMSQRKAAVADGSASIVKAASTSTTEAMSTDDLAALGLID